MNLIGNVSYFNPLTAEAVFSQFSGKLVHRDRRQVTIVIFDITVQGIFFLERQPGLSAEVPTVRIFEAAFTSLSMNYLDLSSGCPAQFVQQSLVWESLPFFFLHLDSSPEQALLTLDDLNSSTLCTWNLFVRRFLKAQQPVPIVKLAVLAVIGGNPV